MKEFIETAKTVVNKYLDSHLFFGMKQEGRQ